ncbi:MAG TPA: hypothetical protein VK846_07145, partial [Candidatus Limnocylindria bacterium]|nr:hypothetical protein [Candidatus Limnocylindria bacterium]
IHMENHYDHYHVNTVLFQGTDVLAYSATTGKVYKMWPGPVTEIIELEKRCHNVGPTKFGWIRNVSGKSIVKVGDHEIYTPIRGDKGEFTNPGWLRGLAWLSETRILVGSSPTMLLEIDLLERKVVAEMKLEDDPGWTTHGIYVDERKCCETPVNGIQAHKPSLAPRRSNKPRGVRKLFKKLGF